MSNGIASITLTRNTWSAIFVAQVWYVYSLILDRENEIAGSDSWRALDVPIRDAIRTFMPALKEAAEHSPEIGKLWFDVRRIAGCFPSEADEDIIKEVVEFF